MQGQKNRGQKNRNNLYINTGWLCSACTLVLEQTPKYRTSNTLNITFWPKIELTTCLTSQKTLIDREHPTVCAKTSLVTQQQD